MEELIYKYLTENFILIETQELSFNYDRFSYWVIIIKNTNEPYYKIINELTTIFLIKKGNAKFIINEWSKTINPSVDLDRFWLNSIMPKLFAADLERGL